MNTPHVGKLGFNPGLVRELTEDRDGWKEAARQLAAESKAIENAAVDEMRKLLTQVSQLQEAAARDSREKERLIRLADEMCAMLELNAQKLGPRSIGAAKAWRGRDD